MKTHTAKNKTINPHLHIHTLVRVRRGGGRSSPFDDGAAESPVDVVIMPMPVLLMIFMPLLHLLFRTTP
jgi:hypothetical protein